MQVVKGIRILLGLFGLVVILSGCATVELAAHYAKKSIKSSADEPVAAPRYKVGDPYEINNIWYYPERNLAYDETGIASWYGDEFGGKLTANGEIFDPSIVSAAHKTLPMPSAVRVINLENGRSLVVRINDRGPFVAGRIIDLSREAARLLGFQKKGIARVRVQILAEETLRLEQEAKEGRFPSISDRTPVSKPNYNAAAVPTVSLTSKSQSGAVIDRGDGGAVSAIDLISSARSTEVIEMPPVETQIWVQVGAFSQEANARNVAAKLNGVGPVTISTVDSEGKVMHRVRVGPIDDVQVADATLASVYSRGFDGAKIVLE
ncbi:MAG: septal ring lytic transglycosylase RlpA family protein [Candidatus Puniceispirillales bacterium]